MKHTSLILPVILTTLALCGLVHGDDAGKSDPFSIRFSGGIEYDSNVAVLELDTSSGEGDLAALIDVGLAFDKTWAGHWKTKLGYDFSQTLHDEFDAFDLQIHRGSAEVGYDFGRIDAGILMHYADAALDGDGFLEVERLAPYASRLFGERLFLRLEYARSDKTFDTNPDRDATSDAVSVDAFVFLDGVRSFFVFGVQGFDEDAVDALFDYDGMRLKAQYAWRLTRAARELEFKVGLRHESRDYDAMLPLVGQRREDDRLGFEAELKVPLSGKWFVQSRYRYNDNDSNLALVDFDEHVASIEIGAKF